jgi:glycosyltransferase involved in cell wall biosynthesis
MLIGALPPPIGGTTVSLRHLKEYLEERVNAVVTVDCSTGRRGIAATSVRVLIGVLRHILRVDVVTLHFSDRASISIAPILWIASRLFRRPVIYRQFGGEFAQTYRNMPAVVRWWLRSTIFSSEAVLLQTKKMILELDPGGTGRTQWFPTARPRAKAVYRGDFAQGRSKSLRCLFLGHVRRAKGVLIAAEGVRMVPGAHLDVVGPLIDVETTELEAMGAAYLGVVDPDSVASIMAQYDVLVFPTTYAGEGYPGTLVEAAMVGLPIVISRWKELPEMFDADEAVFVVPNSADEICAALMEFVESPEALLRRSGALKKRSNDFDSEFVFAGFLDTCHEVSRLRTRDLAGTK